MLPTTRYAMTEDIYQYYYIIRTITKNKSKSYNIIVVSLIM